MDATTKTSPKDVFLHILTMVALYSSAISFLVLMFQYVNILFPDPANVGGSFAREGAFRAIRWSIATLVIVFPVYLGASWFLDKGYRENPLTRNLRIRKWLIYFTLFVAAIIIIGDLVALIYNLLEGEITLRFILKVLAVFFVAGSTFAYYLWDVRRYAE